MKAREPKSESVPSQIERLFGVREVSATLLGGVAAAAALRAGQPFLALLVSGIMMFGAVAGGLRILGWLLSVVVLLAHAASYDIRRRSVRRGDGDGRADQTTDGVYVSAPRGDDSLEWDFFSVVLGVGAIVIAMENGQPILRALGIGIIVFGALASGLRVLTAVWVAVASVVRPIFDKIEGRFLWWRSIWQVRRMMLRPLHRTTTAVSSAARHRPRATRWPRLVTFMALVALVAGSVVYLWLWESLFVANPEAWLVAVAVVIAVSAAIQWLVLPIYDMITYYVLRWRVGEQNQRMIQRPLPPAPPRAPVESLHGVEGASMMRGEDRNLMVTSVDSERWTDADAQRWGDTASFKIFNKSIDALIDDYERTMGGFPADMHAALIRLGREIERADTEKAAASKTRAEGSGETARLAEIAAHFLAGKPLSALTAGLSPAAATGIIDALAAAGRFIEERRRSSASTSE